MATGTGRSGRQIAEENVEALVAVLSPYEENAEPLPRYNGELNRSKASAALTGRFSERALDALRLKPDRDLLQLSGANAYRAVRRAGCLAGEIDQPGEIDQLSKVQRA